MEETIKLKDILKKRHTISAQIKNSGETITIKRSREEKLGLNLTIGVFFDGTQNNMYNTLARKYNSFSSEIKKLIIDPEELSADSFKNDYSNVAKLWGLYKDDRLGAEKRAANSNTFPVYVQGIGTLRKEADNMDSVVMGTGERGVIDKVKDACETIAIAIDNLLFNREEETYIKSITLDVFGFSRGSAAARHFINEVNILGHTKYILKKGDTISSEQPVHRVARDNTRVSTNDRLKRTPGVDKSVFKRARIAQQDVKLEFNSGGELGRALRRNGITYLNSIKVNFVGLFDTVASTVHLFKDKSNWEAARTLLFGSVPAKINTILEADLSGSNHDEGDINVYLAPNAASKVVHLVARDEYRINFPLTSIGEGETISLPGVHSDIGGGYTDGAGENVPFAHGDTMEGRHIIEEMKRRLLAEGWYDCEEELIVEHKTSFKDNSRNPGRFGEDNGTIAVDHATLYGRRASISTAYSLIPLEIMRAKAKDCGVPFIEMHEGAQQYGFQYSLEDPKLKDLQDLFKQQIAAGKTNIGSPIDEKNWLRRTYLHHSSNIDPYFGEVGHPMLGFNVLMTARAADGNKRIVHPNHKQE